MSVLREWWQAPKPALWVAWCDYCGAAGLYALWLVYDNGPAHWEGSVATAVTWPVHLVQAGWQMIGGAA